MISVFTIRKQTSRFELYEMLPTKWIVCRDLVVQAQQKKNLSAKIKTQLRFLELHHTQTTINKLTN